MPRGSGRRRRQDPVEGREQLPQRVRRAPREEAQQPPPVDRNLRATEEAPLERRQRVLIERYPGKASELFSYMSMIMGAAADHPVEKWYTYNQQFRLRVSRDHTKTWSSIDGFLWLRILTTNTQKQQSYVGYKCYDFNLKGLCNKRNYQYRHACFKCGFNHPALRCRRFMDNEVNTGPSRFKRNNIAPLINNSAYRQNLKEVLTENNLHIFRTTSRPV
ncbi:unnamed protein product [Mytilus coruscus]|uniref:Uncharacterized protein n=1 Tax=Mytilus coruscus TaxID=42192 RepID=A0A6J8APL3_MYTCO|nr:unnamed protein product [Mytilus coruscus]